jgi:catechol 2,3-dioxygenase-like lactoylglutathione lyase family enzyme
MAIIGMHAIMYSKKDDATRAFFRDVLGFPAVDAGRGWLIFAAPPAEIAVHPTDSEEHHELYLMCDDIEATIADLTQKVLPSGEEFGLYEPKHPTALNRPL